MSSSVRISPFSQAVINSMQRLYPDELSDKSFDNTGLLLEAPQTRDLDNSVLLCNDLTTGVASEAIEKKASIVITYHPIIFRALKSLTLKNSQQQSLLRLANAGISVYSPHTAVDAQTGGNGDWLADIVTGRSPSSADAEERSRERLSAIQWPTRQSYALNDGAGELAHTRSIIQPTDPKFHFHDTGIGRLVRLEAAVPLRLLLKRIAYGTGLPSAFNVAIPQTKTIDDISVSSIGICAGSGGSILGSTSADLFLTGEMSHHEALAAIEKGCCVVALGHSNSERAYLTEVLKPRLEQIVEEEWGAVREKESEEHAKEFTVLVSEVDRDPFGVVTTDRL